MKTITITVKGKVQGVYYRHFTKTKAEAIGITGTVKNLPDGNVFIVATGQEYQLSDLIKVCKVGPPRAEVTEIIHKETNLQHFFGFEIIR
ncbi:MAG: acylphosphatase [Sphingobacteriales bacterium]|nr:acylphosphatase [Sphingobacteriales bacterium]